jgi:hypothetical protein
MPVNNTKTQLRKREVEASNDPGPSDEPSPLLVQAQAWADVAREANGACVQGDEAERVLQQRRNSPGQ